MNYSAGQNVVYTSPTSGESNSGQVWGADDRTGLYVVFIPAIDRCVRSVADNLDRS